MEKGRSIVGYRGNVIQGKRDKQERERIRGKILPIIEKTGANEKRRDNLTEKERKGMRDIKRRKYIIIQPADKG